MQYMLLIIADESKPPLANADLVKLMDAYRQFGEDIARSGHLRSGAPLQPSSSATTVREKGGKRHTEDGPFADGKRHLAGYYIVECENLDQAIGIAWRVPGLRLGEAVEVRPLVPTPGAATAASVR